MLSTPLCALLGIDHPVLNAPMSGTATAELAAAVSGAGGFGMIGGTSTGGPDWLRAQIRAARARTDRPFGVGFMTPGHDIGGHISAVSLAEPGTVDSAIAAR